MTARHTKRALVVIAALMAACSEGPDGEGDGRDDEAALETASGLTGFQWTASARSATFRALTFEKSGSGVTYTGVRNASGATESGRATVTDGGARLELARGGAIESFALTKGGATTIMLAPLGDAASSDTYARGPISAAAPPRAPILAEGRRALVRIGTKVYAFGPQVAPIDRKRPVDVVVYDDLKDTWEALPASPPVLVPGHLMAAALPDGSISVVSDGETAGHAAASSLRFEPASRAWEKTESSEVRSQFGIGACPDGRVYGFGGWAAAPLNASQNQYPARPLDIDTGVVARVPVFLAENPGPHVLDPAVVAMPNGKIYVIGGQVPEPPSYNSSPTSPSVFAFDCATNTYAAKAPMKLARMGHAAVHDGKGHIVVFGGTKQRFGEPQRAVERYDVATDTWSDLPDMPRGADGAVAILGPKPNLVWLARGGLTYADVVDLGSGQWHNGLDPWLPPSE